jgi:hypothetical protein
LGGMGRSGEILGHGGGCFLVLGGGLGGRQNGREGVTVEARQG